MLHFDFRLPTDATGSMNAANMTETRI